MISFKNGHLYQAVIALAPPAGQSIPFIKVEIGLGAWAPELIVGKLDTGASITMLTFDTATILGLGDPTTGGLRTRMASTASDQKFPYYVHRVLVTVPSPTGQDLNFPLEAGFAKEVKRNLFGVDWLAHMCVAIDSEQVHLLRD